MDYVNFFLASKILQCVVLGIWLKFFSLSQDFEGFRITCYSWLVPEKEWTYWDEKVSAEDLDEMWRHPEVKKEWTGSNEKRGQVRFARDAELRPYLTTTEVKVCLYQIISYSSRRHFLFLDVLSRFHLCNLSTVIIKF